MPEANIIFINKELVGFVDIKNYIDLYQFHNPAVCPKPGDGSGMYEAMLEAKAQGKIRHIGITNHRQRTALDAIESGLMKRFSFLLIISRLLKMKRS